MSKFLVLSAVLSLLGGEILGTGLTLVDPPMYRRLSPGWRSMLTSPNMPGHPYPKPPTPDFFGPLIPPPQEETKEVDGVRSLVKALEGLTSSLAHQTSTDSSSSSSSSSSPTLELSNSVNVVGKQLSSEYIVTKGIGAHKLHLRRLPWNTARKICIDEGGNLATITSDAEEKIILEMLGEDKIDAAWIGYHDIFEEGDWVSVLGEPLGKSGWDRWWKKILPNPDNYDNEDCASLCLDGGGINDRSCAHNLPFVCKITAL